MRSSYTQACKNHHNPRLHHCSCYSCLSRSKIFPGHRQHNHGRSDGGYRNHNHRLFCQRESLLHHRRSCVWLSCASYRHAFTFSFSFTSSLGALLPLPRLPQVLHPPHPPHLPQALRPIPRSHLHLHLLTPPLNVSSLTS